MKISVVIPTFNTEASISEAITSCLEQTYSAHEIIVVDDASTDSTCAYAASFEQIMLIQQERNQGPSAARNRGWEAATGDIIAFLDSDDIWHPQKLEHINKLFTEHDELQYLGHKYVLNRFVSVSNNRQIQKKSYLSILLRNPYQPSCLIIKRSLTERFNEQYRYCEDHELSVRIACKHTCHYIDVPLTKLGRPQLSSGGASSNKWKMRMGELRIYTNAYKHKPLILPFIPLLWLYSFGKMMYRSIFKS